MTTEITKTCKLEDLAQRICESYNASQRYKQETIHAGRQAVMMAIETGALLAKAKRMAGAGHWIKWFSDNVKDQVGISLDTASRWITMSKSKKMRQLNNCDGLTKAYVVCGLISDTKPALKPIGLAYVDIIETACAQSLKRIDSVFRFIEDADPTTWPEERKQEVKSKLQPLVELLAKL